MVRLCSISTLLIYTSSILPSLFATEEGIFDLFGGGTDAVDERDGRGGGGRDRHGIGGGGGRGNAAAAGGRREEQGGGGSGRQDDRRGAAVAAGHQQQEGLLDGVLGGLLGRTVQGLGAEVGQLMVNGVAGRFYAPDPNSDIPPHVLRRIMRFCSKHRQHEKCKGHPDWVIDQGILPDLTGLSDELLEFPRIMKFAIPAARKLRLEYLLNGVPDELVKTLPKGLAKTLDKITKQRLVSFCSDGSCKRQKPEYLNMRATLAELESLALKTTLPDKTIEAIDLGVAVRQRRVYEVKKALIKYAGLEEQIEPANDGVFQQDILLTEVQSNAILTQIEHVDEHVMAVSDRPPELIPTVEGASSGTETAAEGPTTTARAAQTKPQNVKRYSDGEKLEMLKQYCQMKRMNPKISDHIIAKRLNIPRTSIMRWKVENMGKN